MWSSDGCQTEAIHNLFGDLNRINVVVVSVPLHIEMEQQLGRTGVPRGLVMEDCSAAFRLLVMKATP